MRTSAALLLSLFIMGHLFSGAPELPCYKNDCAPWFLYFFHSLSCVAGLARVINNNPKGKKPNFNRR